MPKLLQRVVTAVVLLAVLLIVFFRLPPPAAAILIGLLVFVAAWEWSGFLQLESASMRLVYAGLIFALMAGVARFVPAPLPLVPLLWLGLAWWGVAFAWVLRYPTPIRRDVGAVCGVLVLLPAWAGLLALLRAGDGGPVYVLLVLSIVWAADVGAYFSGRFFGRTKLAPAVSPGKTWEGVIGGLAAAGVAAAIGAAWLNLPVTFLVFAGLSVAAISVVGDLTVSMFKRHAGLKDSGSLFPGHGGVLDRVDSITAAVPLFALEAGWIGIIAN
jgi:phosphatidate cytidylyltransferase